MSRIMAHRGARNLWAKTSRLGSRETLKHGFDAVGFDVHLIEAGARESIRRHCPLSACSVSPLNAPALRARWIETGPGSIVWDDPVLLRSMMQERAAA